MSTRRPYGIAALLAAGLALAGCGGAAQGADTALPEVATVITPDDGGPAQITLSEAAENRLGIETAAVADGPAGLTVPYAALVYEADGSTWVFVRTEAFSYQRAAVTVTGKSGDQVTLSAGPAAGT